jgi:hypothetical protein
MLKGLVTLACLLVCIESRATFKPAPGVVHADHDEEHTDYALSVRVHTLKAGVTVDQADQAVDGFVFELTKRDDLIVYYGFHDATANRYITTATWRTEAGAQASFTAAVAVASGNYLQQLTEESYYLGTVAYFKSVLEVHSAVLLGNAVAVKICNLALVRTWNSTSMLSAIVNYTSPYWEGLSGGLDFSTCFPDSPTADTHFVTQFTWNSTADATAGSPLVQAEYNSRFPGAFGTTTIYSGAVRNFWHSEPGTTPPVSNAATAISPHKPTFTTALLFAASGALAWFVQKELSV